MTYESKDRLLLGIKNFSPRLRAVRMFTNTLDPVPDDLATVPPGHKPFCACMRSESLSMFIDYLRNNGIAIRYQTHNSRYHYIFGHVNPDILK